MPPPPEMVPILLQDHFNQPYRWGPTNPPVVTVEDHGDFVESWSGYGLGRSGLLVPPYVVPALNAEARPLFRPYAGAVRMWVSPSWFSASLTNGTGPGSEAILAEAAAWDGQTASSPRWTLRIDEDGTRVSLIGLSALGPVELLSAPMEWEAGLARLVTLNFGTNGTELYLDGQLAAQGAGTVDIPMASAIVAIGSSTIGTQPVEGVIDEFYSLARPLTAAEAAAHYNGNVRHASMGPVTPEEELARAGARTFLSALEGSEILLELEEFDSLLGEEYGTEQLWLEITGVVSNEVHVILHNTIPEMTYQLLSTTNLSENLWTPEPEPYYALSNTIAAIVQVGDRTNNLFLRARSWVDSDGSGLPDWWQLDWFGDTGVDPYGDSDQDGWVNLQEYQNGTSPTSFNTPPAPKPFEAWASTSESTATLRWGQLNGPVLHYVVERSDDYGYTYEQLATVTAGSDTYQDAGPFHVEDPSTFFFVSDGPYHLNNSRYRVRGVYAAGASASATTVLSWGQEDMRISAQLILGSEGRWQLICPALPSQVQSLHLEWFSHAYYWDGGNLHSVQNVSVTNIIGGKYVFPVSEITNHLPYGTGEATGWGHDLWIRALDAEGRSGPPVPAGQVYQDNAPYWVDGRQHMRQNMDFMLTAPGTSGPLVQTDRTWWDPFYLEFSLPADPNYVESGFLHLGIQYKGYSEAIPYIRRDNLRPFYLNYAFHGQLLDTNEISGFTWQPDSQTVPAPAVLDVSPQWVARDAGNSSEAGVQISQTTVSMSGGVQNFFGLDIEAARILEREFWWSGDFIDTVIPPGTSVQRTGDLWGLYTRTEAPVFADAGYYFAPVNSPGNTMIGGEMPASQQPYPLPLFTNFPPAAQTPLLVAGLGRKSLIAGWSKKELLNGGPGKFGYLGQYFDMAQRQSAEGVWTNSAVDMLSPYGDLFPLEPGPVALVTMPNWGETARGTALVHVVSISLDGNRDGAIDPSFFGPDQTASHRPFRFWVNNDFDRGNYVDGSDWEEDDLKQAGIPDYPTLITPDHSYATCAPFQSPTPRIPSMRDLEDYTRLRLAGLSSLMAVMPSNYTARLTLTGNGQMRIFRAVESDGGTNYLFDELTASNQVAQSGSLFVGLLTSASPIILSGLTNLSEHFIWCGAQRGSAEVHLQILDGSQNLVADTATYIELKDVKEMYERWTVGDVASEGPYDHPYAAAEDLPPGTASFQYGPPESANTPYILLVHGWNMKRWEKDRYAETAFKRLYWQGYQGLFGFFRWPTGNGFDATIIDIITDANNYDKSEFNAWKSAPMLRAFLRTNLNVQYPGQVYLMAHSMGNIVAGEALRTNTPLVQTYIAMQAAVPSHSYDGSAPVRAIPAPLDDQTFNYYAHYWQSNSPPYFSGAAGAASYVNFYNTNDYALENWKIDQNLKPADTLNYAYWQYSGTNYFTKGLLQFTYLSFPVDTHEIFSFCDEARCFALGAQANMAGFSQLDLMSVWPPDTHPQPHGLYSAHAWHSAQFRSTNMKQKTFWQTLLGSQGFDLH
jgi:hypothetical protein